MEPTRKEAVAFMEQGRIRRSCEDGSEKSGTGFLARSLTRVSRVMRKPPPKSATDIFEEEGHHARIIYDDVVCKTEEDCRER